MIGMRTGRALPGLLVVVLLAGCRLPGGGPVAGRTATTPVAARSPGPGATVDLAGFLARAEQADQQLRAATELVRGDLWTGHPRESTRRAIDALDVSPVEQVIPDGLGPTLRGPVLAVFSDLVSRQQGLRGGYEAAMRPVDDPSNQLGLRCLSHNTEATRRYASDLARLRARAAAQPRVRPVAPASLPAAELAVYLRMIRAFNACGLACGYPFRTRPGTDADDRACGEFLPLEAWRIRWGSPEPEGGLPGHVDGLAGHLDRPAGHADGLEFDVSLIDGHWDVSLSYC